MYCWNLVGFYFFVDKFFPSTDFLNNAGMQMEPSQSVGVLNAFIRQIRQNGFFLLIVLLGAGASIYFIFGLFLLIGH
jgi:hypothetical protein